MIRDQTHLIGDQHFFAKAQDEAVQAPADPVNGKFTLVQPVGDILIADDGAGDELREEGDVQQYGEQALLHLFLAAIDIDDIA